MHLCYVDVENELLEIGREAGHLSAKLATLDLNEPPLDFQDEWEASLVCASAAEKVYTGCERVMAKIASDVDGVPVTHSENWHRAVLLRMSHPFPEIRGPIISAKCYSVMDKLRAFRHRERNTYGMDLDYRIVVERASEAVAGFKLFKHEVRAFFGQGNNDEPDDEAAPDASARRP